MEEAVSGGVLGCELQGAGVLDEAQGDRWAQAAAPARVWSWCRSGGTDWQSSDCYHYYLMLGALICSIILVKLHFGTKYSFPNLNAASSIYSSCLHCQTQSSQWVEFSVGNPDFSLLKKVENTA